mgnify:CR=1 FL=1
MPISRVTRDGEWMSSALLILFAAFLAMISAFL